MTQPTPAPVDALTALVTKLLKPGTKTSEFVMLLAVYGGALATLLGAFNTHNATVNAVLKVAALIAAAAGQVGYALSRGNVKAAMGVVATTLAGQRGNFILPPKHASTNDTGAIDIPGLVAGVLVIAGLIWLVIGFTHHRLDTFGLVLLLVGVGVYLVFGGPWVGRWTRNRP